MSAITIKPGAEVVYTATSGRKLRAVVVQNVYGALTLERNGAWINRHWTEVGYP